MLRPLVLIMTAVLCVTGLLMLLSLSAGGLMAALACFGSALALWLSFQGLRALELNASLLAQGLHQRSRGDDDSRGDGSVSSEKRFMETINEGARSHSPAASD